MRRLRRLRSAGRDRRARERERVGEAEGARLRWIRCGSRGRRLPAHVVAYNAPAQAVPRNLPIDPASFMVSSEIYDAVGSLLVPDPTRMYNSGYPALPCARTLRWRCSKGPARAPSRRAAGCDSASRSLLLASDRPIESVALNLTTRVLSVPDGRGSVELIFSEPVVTRASATSTSVRSHERPSCTYQRATQLQTATAATAPLRLVVGTGD
jgi:hypothetical protein